jgi:acyl-CoA reductase-like NAD-dependent aldehyde dehydrogenase
MFLPLTVTLVSAPGLAVFLVERVASGIETGMVFINYPSVSPADLPFGGIGRMGVRSDESAEFPSGSCPV